MEDIWDVSSLWVWLYVHQVASLLCVGWRPTLGATGSLHPAPEVGGDLWDAPVEYDKPPWTASNTLTACTWTSCLTFKAPVSLFAGQGRFYLPPGFEVRTKWGHVHKVKILGISSVVKSNEVEINKYRASKVELVKNVPIIYLTDMDLRWKSLKYV